MRRREGVIREGAERSREIDDFPPQCMRSETFLHRSSALRVLSNPPTTAAMLHWVRRAGTTTEWSGARGQRAVGEAERAGERERERKKVLPVVNDSSVSGR